MPQNAIAMPYLLQVSMTCSSRMEPPGCTMAVTPDAAGALDVVAEGEESVADPRQTPVTLGDPVLFLVRRQRFGLAR